MISNLDKNAAAAAAKTVSDRHGRHMSSPSLSSFSSSSSSLSSSSSSLHRLLRRPQPSQPAAESLQRRRSPLATATITRSEDASCCSGRFGEVAGGTAAECAAIWCCCPCGLVNLLILTVYKVPATLCRRVLKRKRRERMIKKGLLPARARKCQCGCDDTEIQMHPGLKHGMLVDLNGNANSSSNDSETPQGFEEKDAMVKLEKEMWERFYGTGFWRSPSQREQSNVITTTSTGVLRS